MATSWMFANIKGIPTRWLSLLKLIPRKQDYIALLNGQNVGIV
jgi:hypothetical protein